MKSIKLGKVFAALSFFACASLSAAPITFDVSGIESYAGLDDPGNTVRFLNIGANSRITGVTYNVNLTAIPNSFLSEIALLFENSDSTDSRTFFPAFVDDVGDDFPGTRSYSGFDDLAAAGTTLTVGADGILRLEFFEDGFDDLEDAADGFWNSGTITFEVELAEVPGEVPEPSTTLLMGAGLAMLGYAGRRRRAAGKRAA